ncbi:MAG: arginine repressor [Clostridia bacterium]|nr:arginine repressor [Clostridia bacterium]
MKESRQEMLTKLIRDKQIATQDDLIAELRKAGFVATQATISRDIKQLQLIKRKSKSGKYYYALPDSNYDQSADRLQFMLNSAATVIDHAGNLVVIKTEVGMAQALCASIDSADCEDIVGTIAGDDTIFIAVKTQEKAVSLAAKLRKGNI